MILATAVKSQPRILAAMTKFAKQAWYRTVHDFYNRSVQYTSVLAAAQGKFAVVHIPSCRHQQTSPGSYYSEFYWNGIGEPVCVGVFRALQLLRLLSALVIYARLAQLRTGIIEDVKTDIT